MVDALHSAANVLRRRGVVVDVRPAVMYRSELVVRRGRRRAAVLPIRRSVDEDVVAAQRAVRRVVGQGLFDVLRRTRHEWRSRYASLAELDRMLAMNSNWHLAAPTRRRLARVWKDGDTIELSRIFVITILRKRAVRRSGGRAEPDAYEAGSSTKTRMSRRARSA